MELCLLVRGRRAAILQLVADHEGLRRYRKVTKTMPLREAKSRLERRAGKPFPPEPPKQMELFK